MEIKAQLLKPYTDNQRMDFIVEYNHKQNYEIEETETALVALGKTGKELEQEEKERILDLSMTRSDFFDGTIKAFGADSEDLLMAIQGVLATLPISDIEKKVAINNYKNALNFYRKHPLFNMLSNTPIPITPELSITITDEQWDKFFDETNKKNPDAYKELIAITVEHNTMENMEPLQE